VFVKKPLFFVALCATSVSAFADPWANSSFIHKWSDVQFYLKPKYNGVRSWDQEFGFQATMYKHGNVAEVTNFCYDPTYPLRIDQKPRWSLGFQVNYYLTQLPWKVAIYTKPKASPLPYVWKDESGFTWRFYTSRSLIVSSNLAYVFNIPYHHGQLPQWLALVNIQFPLG